MTERGLCLLVQIGMNSKLLFATAFGALTPFVALAAPVASVQKINTVYDHSARGDAYFNKRLRAEMRQMGLRFVADRKKADVILDSWGEGSREGGFKANMTLRDRAGRIVWRESVSRPTGSRVMAFERLGDKLRAARK